MSNKNIDKKLLANFLAGASADNAPIYGEWEFLVTRANGGVERRVAKNTLSSEGLNYLAQLGVGAVSSTWAYIAIGTQTAASSLGSVQGGMGEVVRKLASTITTSKEFMILVSTFAGAADGVTSLDLRTASGCNHVDSGEGEHLNYVNSVATVLADSDFLRVQMNVRVGSHNL